MGSILKSAHLQPWRNMRGLGKALNNDDAEQRLLFEFHPPVWLTFQHLRLSLKTCGLPLREFLTRECAAHTGRRRFQRNSAYQQNVLIPVRFFFSQAWKEEWKKSTLRWLGKELLRASLATGNNLPAVLLYKWCESAIEALLIEWVLQLQLMLMFISIFSSTPSLRCQAVWCAVITHGCRHTFFSSSHSDVNESTATIQVSYLHNVVFLCIHHTFNKDTEKITISNGHLPHSLSSH